jgi:uncharacterized protein (TIGR03086 family)
MPSTTIDLHPATQRVGEIVRGVSDEQLTAATPCPDYTLGDLLDHVNGLSVAFTAAARKETLPGAQSGPSADAGRLGDDWRDRIPQLLDGLADAWQQPEAWTGMTQAGPVELPGEVAGLVALNEVVLHGWDSPWQAVSHSTSTRRLCRRPTTSSPSSPDRDTKRIAPADSAPRSTCRRTPRCSTACSAWPAGSRSGRRRGDRPLGLHAAE